LERWQQYFKELLNFQTARINSINIHKSPINNSELEEPMYDEIIKKIETQQSCWA
jgi:ABC-type oligopeptide transport system substrate-binding subunit